MWQRQKRDYESEGTSTTYNSVCTKQFLISCVYCHGCFDSDCADFGFHGGDDGVDVSPSSPVVPSIPLKIPHTISHDLAPTSQLASVSSASAVAPHLDMCNLNAQDCTNIDQADP